MNDGEGIKSKEKENKMIRSARLRSEHTRVRKFRISKLMRYCNPYTNKHAVTSDLGRDCQNVSITLTNTGRWL